MGCYNSKACSPDSQRKKKNKVKQGKKNSKEIGAQDGSGKLPLDELCAGVEKRLEQYVWQVKVLQDALEAEGNLERDKLLKTNLHGDLCLLVHSITEKVKQDTANELQGPHAEQMRKTFEEHTSKLQELEQLHTEEKKTLTETHLAERNEMKEQIESLTGELKHFTELKRRVEASTLKKDLQRNIETHGSPGAFWEQEQESLLFVIEMKSESIQEQRNRLLQMEALAEKKLSLEDQLVHVLQQNEDLRVRMENYQTLIQQLSKEQRDLQEALERQCMENQKLSQEKEELLFKLLHNQDSSRSSRSSFHMSAPVPQASVS
ncbi:coiled-coil domain-containing protein 69 [Chanos chanos]|uniref:Coiled-coil domain-containing protein 69 n=1 Tax=Chanos chanos TaxID=29144 RepID=A0A6J2UNA2_CHACN|nr:coiled-coil domain-containing protein 69 [Chanos chanos]